MTDFWPRSTYFFADLTRALRKHDDSTTGPRINEPHANRNTHVTKTSSRDAACTFIKTETFSLQQLTSKEFDTREEDPCL